MKTKNCSKCREEKILENNFYMRNGKPQSRCKECVKLKSKNYRDSNKGKYFDYFREYQQINKKDIKEYKRQNYLKNQEKVKERSKEYYENNKEEHNKYTKEYNIKNREDINRNSRDRNQKRRDNDPLYRLSNNIRTSISTSIKRCGYKKDSKTYDILGCSYEDFILYIESKFENWMTWENYGKYNGKLYHGWDIDHIIPVSTTKTKEEILSINHYTNLQPLCSKINRNIKKDKLNYEIL